MHVKYRSYSHKLFFFYSHRKMDIDYSLRRSNGGRGEEYTIKVEASGL